MAQELVVTIDGEEYRVEGSGTAEQALAGYQQFMREGALEELTLVGGRRMVVHWGRVTAVSVTADDSALSYSGPAEPRWPERPF